MFFAIDVETANSNLASICQIGIASFSEDGVEDEWVSLVDPEDIFDAMNMAVHGITPEAVKGAPTFDKIFEVIELKLTSSICVCHTHFDRCSLSRASNKHSLILPSIYWLDSARVARRTWPDVSRKGYGLDNLCKKINYQFKHHDALEDAKAAGHILLAAIRESGHSLEEWLQRVERPIASDGASYATSITKEANPEGMLFGEVCVFTGSLEIPRREAAAAASAAGCKVVNGVSKKVTLVVVGDQDISKLAGHEISSKQRKAEHLAEEGYPIRIITESDFKELVRY